MLEYLKKNSYLKYHAKLAIKKYYSFLLKNRNPYNFIFILSHMRSGSTLLSHLLISHKDICGFGESHMDYKSPDDLEKITHRVLFERRRFIKVGNERYILDKILHNHLLQAQDIKNIINENLYIIFLARNPINSIQSIIKSLDYTETEAKNYYISRLDKLIELASELKKFNKYLMINYEDLIDAPDVILEKIQMFLNLDLPLSKRYKLINTTGKKGYGDSSDKIKLGEINSTMKNDNKRITLNIATINSCNKYYEQLLKVLKND